MKILIQLSIKFQVASHQAKTDLPHSVIEWNNYILTGT